ncbi:ABC transporter ATP-binding protein [Neobacillus massiliamazoniensis]|uniref:Multidrug ABC transporter ATP-binding protein/permease n=1 Tax=Neobacillus massiliamazoniensis TaxID=1499688 RepID=A0A0U1NQM6_9BACI|nr:ABC transporter transmembrane domain-containing protein [Neobacillus massiliamazoniensis]CRK80351.1 multidrug ABC transporter ATP-binding protein/permease [Neobacillus massiliamazoniensis]
MEKIDVLSEKEQRKVLFRLLSYTKPHTKTIALAFILLILTTVGDIFLPILVKTFIDDYLTPRKLIFQQLFILGSVYMGIQVVKAVLLFFQLVLFQGIALKIIQQLRIDVFSKVQALGLKFFDKTPAGSIVSRVTNDTEAIKDMFVTVIATFIQSGFLLVGIFIAMFILNAKLALLCVIIIPLILFVMTLYRKLSSRFYLDMRERLSQLNAKLSESLQGMAIVQMFRQEKRLRQEFGEINDQHFKAGMKNIKIDGLLLRPAIDLIYIFALIIVLSYFGITSFQNSIQIGVLYAFVNYLDRFFEPVVNMMMRLSLYQQAIVAGSRVFKLLDNEELAPKQADRPNVIKKGKIEFKNVSFSYDGKRDVLKNISFTANPGETVALVGHTGSGKSSIINLLMRFYEYNRGDILIDGDSIRSFTKQELREKLGLVLQDPFLFYGTVKDNIRLHNDTLTDEQIREAAEFVQANVFIERLEDGYDDKVVERGATFSSGQRQLIAFARTIAANPKILILDEATANIDTETEESIQTALARMRRGRTTIAIAHRLSTIQDADSILVLHQGEIVESGTHQELLAQGGLYYKMFLLQNGTFERLENVVNK